MTCELSRLRQQLDDLQKLVDEYEKRHCCVKAGDMEYYPEGQLSDDAGKDVRLSGCKDKG